MNVRRRRKLWRRKYDGGRRIQCWRREKECNKVFILLCNCNILNLKYNFYNIFTVHFSIYTSSKWHSPTNAQTHDFSCENALNYAIIHTKLPDMFRCQSIILRGALCHNLPRLHVTG
jgi:hypothetical protein